MLMGELEGRGEDVPRWAEGCATELFHAVVAEIDRDLAARRIPYRLDLKAGSLTFTPCGLSPQKLELWMLVDTCSWKERAAWAAEIRGFLDPVLRTATLCAITRDQLAASWNLASQWLRLQFERDWQLKESTDCMWWEIAPGLATVLTYGLPNIYGSVPLEHVQRWGISRDELFRIAVRNLRNGPRLPARKVDREDWGPMEIYKEPLYPYTASHLLFLEEYLDPAPPEGVVLAVPKDNEFEVFRLTSRANEAALRKLARVIPEFYIEAYSAVSPYLYWWRNGVFTPLNSTIPSQKLEYCPPPEFTQLLQELRGVAS